MQASAFALNGRAFQKAQSNHIFRLPSAKKQVCDRIVRQQAEETNRYRLDDVRLENGEKVTEQLTEEQLDDRMDQIAIDFAKYVPLSYQNLLDDLVNPQVFSTQGRMIEKSIEVRRVAHVTQQGNKLRFRATAAVGNGKGLVGVATAKAPNMGDAMRKATRNAKKNIIRVPIRNGTIPHAITQKRAAALVTLKPKHTPGIYGGPAARAICQCAGIEGLYTKQINSRNKKNNADAIMLGLSRLRTPEQVAEDRDLTVDYILSNEAPPADAMEQLTAEEIQSLVDEQRKLSGQDEEPVENVFATS